VWVGRVFWICSCSAACTLTQLKMLQRSERSLGVPEVINGSPRIIEAYSRVHSSQSARSNGWMEDSAGAKQVGVTAMNVNPQP
jgi:hypothetical protein